MIRTKPQPKLHHYHGRLSERELLKYHEIHEVFMSNKDFQSKLQKWKAGINFITNKEIANAKIHSDLKYILLNQIGHNVWCNESIYEKIKDIDIKSYVEETKKIQLELDILNEEVDRYNRSLFDIHRQIDKLYSFFEFVEFDGNKYGIPPVIDGIHRENDCMGVITDIYKNCSCTLYCRKHPRSGFRSCDMCDYKINITERA